MGRVTIRIVPSPSGTGGANTQPISHLLLRCTVRTVYRSTVLTIDGRPRRDFFDSPNGMETVQRLDVGRWHVHSLPGEYVAAYNIVSAGGFELSLSQSSLAPLMDERDRAAGAMRQHCATLAKSTEMIDNFEQHCSLRESEP